MSTRRRQYLEYLDSAEWWAIRKRALARARYRCARQGPGEPLHPGPLDVHHIDYIHFGMELEGDTEVLCDPCHVAEHAPKNRALRMREQHGQRRLFDRWK